MVNGIACKNDIVRIGNKHIAAGLAGLCGSGTCVNKRIVADHNVFGREGAESRPRGTFYDIILYQHIADDAATNRIIVRGLFVNATADKHGRRISEGFVAILQGIATDDHVVNRGTDGPPIPTDQAVKDQTRIGKVLYIIVLHRTVGKSQIHCVAQTTFKSIVSDNVIAGVFVHVPELVGVLIVCRQGILKGDCTAPWGTAVCGMIVLPFETDNFGFPTQISELCISHAKSRSYIDFCQMHPLGQMIQSNRIVVDLGVAGNSASEKVVGQVNIIVVDAL